MSRQWWQQPQADKRAQTVRFDSLCDDDLEIERMKIEETATFLRMVGCFIVRLRFVVGGRGRLWHVGFFQPNRGGISLELFGSLSRWISLGCGTGNLSPHRRISHRQVRPEKSNLLQHDTVWNRPSLT